jgi:hypothetical protein
VTLSPTRTVTPSATLTTTATATSTPTLSPTPTTSPIPRYKRRYGKPLVISKMVGGVPTASLYYAVAARSGAGRRFDATGTLVQSLPVFDAAGGAALAVALGDVDGDGGNEVIVGHNAGVGQPPSNRVDVYRIGPRRTPALLGAFAAFDGSHAANSGNLAVGDVDASVGGDEIVVAEDGRLRRASQVRVFGGWAEGHPRLLCQFTAVPPRLSARQPLAFALGHVGGDAAPPGETIVVGAARGSVYVWSVYAGHPQLLHRFAAFLDSPRRSARHLAVGDVIPQRPGDEIVVADDGTQKDALVRVFDGRSGTPLIEFSAFEAGQAPAGVEVWVADVIGALPGAEVIVGQGRAGGLLRVFSITDKGVTHVLDLPDPYHRSTSLRQHLAVGALIPDLPGNQVVVAQSDLTFPVQVFGLAEEGVWVIEDLGALAPDEPSAADAAGTVDTIAAGR